MAAVVEGHTEDVQVVELAKYVVSKKKQKDSSFPTTLYEECQRDAAAWRAEKAADTRSKHIKTAVGRLMEHSDIFLESNVDREVEGCINILFTLCVKLDPSLATTLRDKVASSTERALLRLRMLNNFFNYYPHTSIERFHTVIIICDLAKKSNRVDIIAPKMEQIENLLSTSGWDLTQKRRFYQVTIDLLKTQHKSECESFVMKYLQTFQGCPPDQLELAATETTALVVSKISSPSVFEMDDIMHLDVVKHLASSTNPAQSGLLGLLKVFVSGSYSDFVSLADGIKPVFDTHGISRQVCEEKMRLLQLAQLASSRPTLSLRDVAQGIAVPDSEVENWLLRGVGAHVITCKINQANNTVALQTLITRSFGPEDWNNLSKDLKMWRNSLAGLLQVVKTASQQS
ncbi:carbohydrate-binding protein [Pelomyxa schiedti]|nr:carbohydrate-binding protein [Pelomyxa schiedti]